MRTRYSRLIGRRRALGEECHKQGSLRTVPGEIAGYKCSINPQNLNWNQESTGTLICDGKLYFICKLSTSSSAAGSKFPSNFWPDIFMLMNCFLEIVEFQRIQTVLQYLLEIVLQNTNKLSTASSQCLPPNSEPKLHLQTGKKMSKGHCIVSTMSMSTLEWNPN